ncbi:MAG: hypothetical protein AAGK09_10765 [Planctomycetota bacterium]
MASTDTANPSRDNPGLVSGKLVVLASIVVFVLIGVAFWAAGKWFSANPIEADDTLDYANRAEWVVMPASTILLTEPPRYMRGPYGSKIKKELPFSITAEGAQLVTIWSNNARLESPQSLPNLLQIRPYPYEVLWYQDWMFPHDSTLGDRSINDLRGEALINAPGILVLKYHTEQDHPFGNQPIGDIELTFARKADDVLDDSLRLYYPDNRTDEFGRIYLPVFDTPLQVSAKPDPPGYEAEYPFSGWLIFPGKVGGPEPIVVRPKGE